MSKHIVPYKTFGEGQKDGWAKIGGTEAAWQCIKQGYYNLQHRKERNMLASVGADLIREDPQLAARVKARLDEELGRTKKTA